MSAEQADRDAEAVRKGFRITLDMIKSEIALTLYTSPWMCVGDGGHVIGKDMQVIDYKRELETMTVCYIVTKSGFVVVGKTAPVDPDNFNAELGRKLAYDDAIRQLWPMFAFQHKQRP